MVGPPKTFSFYFHCLNARKFVWGVWGRSIEDLSIILTFLLCSVNNINIRPCEYYFNLLPIKNPKMTKTLPFFNSCHYTEVHFKIRPIHNDLEHWSSYKKPQAQTQFLILFKFPKLNFLETSIFRFSFFFFSFFFFQSSKS